MNSIQDRISAATRAAADTVRPDLRAGRAAVGEARRPAGQARPFDWITNGTTLALRLLDVGTGGVDLLTASRQVVTWNLPGGLTQPALKGATATGAFRPVNDPVITLDGSAVVTAAEQGETRLAGNAVTWVTTRTAVQEYSVSTGKLLRTFGLAKTRPAVFRCGVLWSDPAGDVVIGLTTGGRVAVITGHHVVPLNRPPSVLPGNADAGTW
jgi:hypothetical protein